MRWFFDRPVVRFTVGLIGIFVILPLVLGRFGMRLDTAIFLGTGIIVLWYAVETGAMRRQMVRQTDQMVRQNELAVQPLLIAGLDPRTLDSKQLVVRNIGRGPALFIRLEDIKLTDPADPFTRPSYVARFTGVDWLEAGKDTAIHAEPDRPYVDFVAALDPDFAVEPYRVTLFYEDMNGQQHKSVMQMGKGGIRLLRPDNA